MSSPLERLAEWTVTIFTRWLILSSDFIEGYVSLTDFRRIPQYQILRKFVMWEPNWYKWAGGEIHRRDEDKRSLSTLTQTRLKLPQICLNFLFIYCVRYLEWTANTALNSIKGLFLIESIPLCVNKICIMYYIPPVHNNISVQWHNIYSQVTLRLLKFLYW